MMNALTVLLLCLAAACAVPTHFPTENKVIYNYHADVKAGIIEPANYVSQFALNGQLHIVKDVSDPTLNNVYYIKLNDITYDLYNGVTVHHHPVEFHKLEEAAQQLEDPFLIIYDEYGKLEGIKVPETESCWSKNIKQGIASMLQLDLTRIQLQVPMKAHSFITHENTIHGTCQVAYDVHSKKPTTDTNLFVVTKVHNLKNCSHFVQRVFDNVECQKCHVESVDDITTTARRVFEITQQDSNILIKHLIAHSDINYVPYNSRSEVHYLSTNTTLDLHSLLAITQAPMLAMTLKNVPIIRDITFNKPLGNYAFHAAEDLTHGRHIVKLDTLIPKLKKMLAEAADYLEENHLEATEPDWKHGQTINRLQHTMNYMDLGSLEQVYNAIQEPKTAKEIMMKNIFLRMVPTVGTTATCHFTRNVILKNKVTDTTAVAMLIKLPMHVKMPSEKLLLEMEDLLKLDNMSREVRKTGILCFSILVRKTFLHQHSDVVNPLLQKYLHRFLDHVKNEETYDMKMLYMMAIRNVQVGNIEKLLKPIIRGEELVSENPHHIRIQAIWAIKKAVVDKVEFTHDLLWPILADVTQPLPIRIAAYDVLMSQLPNMQRLLQIYWLMFHEQNNHLYNYHFTTLKGLANSVDPCLTPVREMARKILRYTKIRPVIDTHLSSKHFIDYTDPIYNHGESWNSAWVLDELTGMPHAGYMEHHVTVARKPIDKIGVYWSVYGLDEIMKIVKKELMGTTVENINNKNVQNLLIRAAQDMPVKKHIHVDICVTLNGHVILANYYDQGSFRKLFEDMLQMQSVMTDNIQDITYDVLYEMQVPIDMGLQGVLSTKMPQLSSMKYNIVQDTEVKKPSVNMKLEVDTRVWRHGEYVMSIYNPIADVWHSVRRATVQDIALPVDMNLVYNHEAKSLKVTVPRLPLTKLSHTGIRYFAKSLVTITEDEQDVLKTCCVTCHHHTVVTTGEKRNHHVAVDSKDVGLKYSMSIFDCENKMTPATNAQEWYRVLSPEHKNTWGSWLTNYIMGIRQKLFNDYISPEMGNCGMLLKIEPSIVYPTSHVDLNVRVNVENVDHVHDKIHTLSSNKINVRGTLNTKAASTNESIRSWDVNVNIDMSQGHIINNVKVQMMRETPGEKKLKICLDAQKNYPVVETDYLKLNTVKEETNTKMTLSAGFTDDDKCVRDDMAIAINIKGEMTEEQKKQMTHDNVHGDCVKDTRNQQFVIKQNYVPKTMNCLREAMLYTTMRKYTLNMSYKKVPVNVLSQLIWIEDYIRASHLPHVKYTLDRVESGNAKVIVEFPSDLTYVNASVVTPVNGYEYIQLPLHQSQLYEGMGKPISHPGWHVFMDNTRLSVGSLYKLTQGQAKICTVYPQVLITLDEGVIPFIVSDKWTLISGDHIDQTYAIFVKSVQGNKLAVKVYIADHEMEIVPKDNVVVTADGNVVEQHEKGVVLPKNELKSYAIKLTETNEHIVVQSQRVPLLVLWTPNSVTLMADTSLQGQMTGVCGHMDGTHKEKLPKIYVGHV